jgi:hypothetical protein
MRKGRCEADLGAQRRDHEGPRVEHVPVNGKKTPGGAGRGYRVPVLYCTVQYAFSKSLDEGCNCASESLGRTASSSEP